MRMLERRERRVSLRLQRWREIMFSVLSLCYHSDLFCCIIFQFFNCFVDLSVRTVCPGDLCRTGQGVVQVIFIWRTDERCNLECLCNTTEDTIPSGALEHIELNIFYTFCQSSQHFLHQKEESRPKVWAYRQLQGSEKFLPLITHQWSFLWRKMIQKICWPYFLVWSDIKFKRLYTVSLLSLKKLTNCFGLAAAQRWYCLSPRCLSTLVLTGLVV